MAKTRTGIYAIRNLKTGDRYVGRAVHIPDRWRQHREELTNGSTHSPKLQEAWTLYGPSAFVFEVLEECEREDLDDREQHHLWEGCAYNHVQPLPALVVGLTSGEFAPLIEQLDAALAQLGPEELAAYEAELDAQERKAQEAEATEDRRGEEIVAFGERLLKRSDSRLSESEIAQLLESIERDEGFLAVPIANAAARAGQHEAAECILLKLCEATEKRNSSHDYGVTPLPYERLAVLYRKTKRPVDERAILERFARQRHGPSAATTKLLARLAKMQQRPTRVTREGTA